MFQAFYTEQLLRPRRRACLFQVLPLIITLIHTSDKFDKCGIQNIDLASLFAISDIAADDMNAPWLASVGKYIGTDSVENYQVICSGSILTIKHVVTAGHCFVNPNNPSIVRVGANNKDSRYSEDRRIKEHKTHTKYQYPKYYFDVAVILLEYELTFSARISAICLPQNPSSQPTSNSLTVQGWGKNNKGTYGKMASEVREV